ncbi:MAG: hypothetical protein FWG12_04020 [Holophagaceae bacterium]|nr:hypothetical protein [Holophagaceae bacterium]
MPDFSVQSFVGWLHFVSLVVAGGVMPVCLILSGFEETNEDVRGISAVIWKKLAVWGMRSAFACGLALLVINWINRSEPFSQPILLSLLVMAGLLVWLCEAAPKALGTGKRGTALMAMALFLVVSFVITNRTAFARSVPDPDPAPASVVPTHQEVPTVAPLED